MMPESHVYPFDIANVMSLTPAGENVSMLAMTDVRGNQVTLRVEHTAMRSLLHILGIEATMAP